MSAPARPTADGAAAGAPPKAAAWAWTGSALEPVDDAAERDDAERDAAGIDAATLVADSWLVVDGRVLALDRHAQRFAASVDAAGGDALDARAAIRASTALVPAGRWSPRVDLTPGGIRLRIRPAPPVQTSVDVVTAARDPRAHPLTKGPDLLALAALQREESEQVGAPVEPVLAPGGRLAEGAWSALLWWRDGVLHLPPADVARLPSVTAAVLAELARLDGTPVVEAAAAPADLEGCEVWLANALRGIRAVGRWHEGPTLAAPTRAAAWRARLDGLRTRPIGAAR